MSREISEQYLSLITKFQLKPIESAEHNRQALEVLNELIIRDNQNELSTDELGYLRVLANLIKEFEKIYDTSKASTPREILLFLLETHNIKQIELASKLNIPKSHISSFLGGARGLSKTEIGRIATNFGISPLLLVPANYFMVSTSVKRKPSDTLTSKFKVQTAKKSASTAKGKSKGDAMPPKRKTKAR
jgi:antitoxin component HigA of HigAB toxin-antitoxin module